MMNKDSGIISRMNRTSLGVNIGGFILKNTEVFVKMGNQCKFDPIYNWKWQNAACLLFHAYYWSAVSNRKNDLPLWVICAYAGV